MKRLHTPIAALGLGIVAVTATGTAVATTGGTFLLGKNNTASSVTTLTNTKGTALSLKAPAGKPPLAVSNGVRIPKLNADMVDGLHASSLQRRVSGSCPVGQAARAVTAGGALTCKPVQAPDAHVVTIAATGTGTVNGTALTNALAGITDASATNPYLVVLGPGTYDMGSSSVVMKTFVDLAGSGQTVTTITSSTTTCQAGAPPTAGVVDLAPSATLRDLTVISTATGPTCWGITLSLDSNSAPAYVDNVTAISSTAVDTVGAAADGGSTLYLRGVTITSTGGTDFSEGARADNGSTLVFRESALVVDGPGGIFSVGRNEASTILIADSQLDAIAFNDGTGGTTTCFDVYTSAFTAGSC